MENDREPGIIYKVCRVTTNNMARDSVHISGAGYLK